MAHYTANTNRQDEQSRMVDDKKHLGDKTRFKSTKKL